MAYDDWDSQFQDFFDEIPGTDYLDDQEESIVEALFEAGFTHTAEEYEAMGMTEDEVQAVRDEFFEYMGLEEYEFDWEGWREAMGYE